MPKTYVYWNLHRSIWSLMQRGRVYGHHADVIIKGAEFRVRKAGHAKVLREKRKNVHAFVVGERVINHSVERFGGSVQISYNPFKGAQFYRKDTGEAVTGAQYVRMMPDGKVFAWGVEYSQDRLGSADK